MSRTRRVGFVSSELPTDLAHKSPMICGMVDARAFDGLAYRVGLIERVPRVQLLLCPAGEQLDVCHSCIPFVEAIRIRNTLTDTQQTLCLLYHTYKDNQVETLSLCTTKHAPANTRSRSVHICLPIPYCVDVAAAVAIKVSLTPVTSSSPVRSNARLPLSI